MPTPHYPPLAVRRVLKSLGADIRSARRRRRLSMAVVAKRAFITRLTLQKVEQGDTGVGMGIYASVLHALGLLGALADVGNDPVGRELEVHALPKRVHMPKPTKGGRYG